MKTLAVSLTVFLVLVYSPSAFGFDTSHKLWTSVLAKYQRASDGKLRYASLKRDAKADTNHDFNKYITELKSVKKATFDAWPRNDRMAFLINAYNAMTVKLIIEKHPVKGIKKTVGFLGNPWKKKWKFLSLLEGKIRYLDYIEHKILRKDKEYKDPRIHAAVNCASISCPVLQHVAFTGSNLEQLLETGMRDWMKDKTRNRYDKEEGILYVSKIFDWFDDDFEEAYGSVENAIKKFGPPEALAALKKRGKIKYLSYNWDLNEVNEESPGVARQ